MSLDGYIHFWTGSKLNPDGSGSIYHVNSKYFGKVDKMHDKASLVLAVKDNQYTAIVNGQTILKTYGKKEALLDGSFLYSAQSGTNKDFGIRCNMSNMELWVFEN